MACAVGREDAVRDAYARLCGKSCVRGSLTTGLTAPARDEGGVEPSLQGVILPHPVPIRSRIVWDVCVAVVGECLFEGKKEGRTALECGRPALNSGSVCQSAISSVLTLPPGVVHLTTRVLCPTPPNSLSQATPVR